MIYRDSEKGRSMVEMMGYLMVMMSVIVAIGKIVTAAFNNHRYSTATTQLTELATSMVKAAALDVDYRFVIDDINGDNKMNIIPSSFRIAGKKIFHVFGGEVKVGNSPFQECAGVTDNDGNCSGEYKERVDQFQIQYTKLNKKQCVELAMKNWQKNQYTDLYAMDINGHTWFWIAYGDEKGGAVKLAESTCSSDAKTCAFPVSRARLSGTGGNDVGQCAESNNTITWVFN
ncbi:MAG: hypothetical protein IJ218_04875 [Alphaproteobacteria bacterium]|nr:hypothetical protein [Alphaproteobacteria bacterium]